MYKILYKYITYLHNIFVKSYILHLHYTDHVFDKKVDIFIKN